MDPSIVYENWLSDPEIDEETKEELLKIRDNDAEITDRFYQDLEFGTAGLRGIIGAGTNRMNRYTVARATQGLADYINKVFELAEAGDKDALEAIYYNGRRDPAEKSVAIACDSRHRSDEFSEIAAAVLNANGIKTYVFEELRPTPELSFTIRYLGCIAGINITASHNPAEYNGYKAYWSDGAQVTPPHDLGIMECVKNVKNLSSPKLMNKDIAEEKGLYVPIGRQIDEEYIETLLDRLLNPDETKDAAKNVKVVYTPLHGAGQTIIPETLKKAGFEDVIVVEEQKDPDGDFPTVEFPNPEMDSAFALADKLGREVGADIILATDPDSDRIGVHVRDGEGNYHALSGNLIGAFICKAMLKSKTEHTSIPRDSYVIRSVVTTRLVDAICEDYGVEVVEVLTGFKHIGRTILEKEKSDKGTFIFGYEESYGYLVGDYARDKDACSAALALCEMCAYFKLRGLTMWDGVLDIYDLYGCYQEKTISVTKKGIDGLREIKEDMEKLRTAPPESFGRYKVLEITDYLEPEKTGLPKSNVLIFKLECGWVAVRPSGTEPKIKYYIGVKGNTMEEAEEIIKEIETGLK